MPKKWPAPTGWAPENDASTLGANPRAAPGRGDAGARDAKGGTPMVPERVIREAWLRAEALWECRKDAHGHPGRGNQFVIWAERGGTGRGAWESPHRSDPRVPPVRSYAPRAMR
jgi:hypothetical protein